MAKLKGVFDKRIFAGSNICVYEVNGQFYARSKSSLSRKKVLKSGAFARTRQYAGHMAIASRLASTFYRALPATRRNRSLYQEITGKAASMLYRGMNEEEVRAELERLYRNVP